jgi:hypothetical protein
MKMLAVRSRRLFLVILTVSRRVWNVISCFAAREGDERLQTFRRGRCVARNLRGLDLLRAGGWFQTA